MTVPDNDKLNQEQFLELLRVADPELFFIKQELMQTQVSPMVIAHILRSLNNLLIGTGFGKVEIYMQAKAIKNIKGIENIIIEENKDG